MYNAKSKVNRILEDHPEITTFQLLEKYIRANCMGRMQREVAAHKHEIEELVEARALANRMHFRPF